MYRNIAKISHLLAVLVLLAVPASLPLQASMAYRDDRIGDSNDNLPLAIASEAASWAQGCNRHAGFQQQWNRVSFGRPTRHPSLVLLGN